MKLREFYNDLIQSEANAVEYLRRECIFSRARACTGREGELCGASMSFDTERFRWRCFLRGCTKQESERVENSFFFFQQANGRKVAKLPLNKILELLWLFLYARMTIREVVHATGRGKATIIDWFNLMRGVCTYSMENDPKMIGTGANPVQIDESFFSGRRKYNRGRLLRGNIPAPADAEDVPIANWTEENNLNTETYGVDDPTWCWVLGIYSNKNDVHFLRVRDRSGATLIPVIQKYVESVSVIVTELWRGYNGLNAAGFVRKTVNHSENYVDPETGYHTQGVERAWRTAKTYLHLAIGNRQLFQSHLNEAAWRMRHGHNLNDLFPSFVDDIKTFYEE